MINTYYIQNKRAGLAGVLQSEKTFTDIFFEVGGEAEVFQCKDEIQAIKMLQDSKLTAVSYDFLTVY